MVISHVLMTSEENTQFSSLGFKARLADSIPEAVLCWGHGLTHL